jgi:hypothetical protein
MTVIWPRKPSTGGTKPQGLDLSGSKCSTHENEIRDTFALRSELRAVGYSKGFGSAAETTSFVDSWQGASMRIVFIALASSDWSSHIKPNTRDLEMPKVVHRRQRIQPKDESSRSSVGVESSSVIVVEMRCGDGGVQLKSDGSHTDEAAEC